MLYALIPVMTLGGALGAFFFKQGARQVNGIFTIFIRPKIYLGGIFYVLSALLNVYLLRYLDYSVLYPMTAFTYIWSLIISKCFLGEKINAKKIIGVMAILFGAVLLNL